MDGLERRVIIGKDHLAQPSGIAIDFTMDRIFWTDRSKHYVGSCNLDGGDIQVVVTHRYPFGLTVFEDFVYWTNYAGGKLFKANKFNGKDFHEFIEDFFRTMDINVYHPLAQKSGMVSTLAPQAFTFKNDAVQVKLLISTGTVRLFQRPMKISISL